MLLHRANHIHNYYDTTEGDYELEDIVGAFI